MKYEVLFSKTAVAQLMLLDKNISEIILQWINRHLEGSTEPELYGRALILGESQKCSYSIGKYKLLCEIGDKNLIIQAIKTSLS
ncbi:type II toxin-antitoxin system RelE family toxin [Companilactobacillus zhongbaensis]|uniref:type II toxin-antitoxin system RelE family toxin n=1 Tax=Companilactobacillus zhongbaensis TaxID=2486009 RepID=UPI000F7A3B7B|nr:type II toxin-antitoxin system mRNA interferase toxin, RelE/StbE family [Companilactobacillus zhongbaensis]